jgi:hypothetical protein
MVKDYKTCFAFFATTVTVNKCRSYKYLATWARYGPPSWSSGQSSRLQKGYVLCFLWGTNSIYICYVEERRPPLWSSGQSSWLQIHRSGCDSRRYQIFWEVVGLERGPLRLVSATEELLERKSSGSGLENREYGRMDPSRWPRGTLYPQKLELTSPRSGGRPVCIVRSRTQATEFFRARYACRNVHWWSCRQPITFFEFNGNWNMSITVQDLP